MSNTDQGATPKAPDAAADAPELDRRHVLRRLGGYAASVAPAMLVLTTGAHAARGDNGNDGGPQAPCDNPAWDLGLKRAGHSGC